MSEAGASQTIDLAADLDTFRRFPLQSRQNNTFSLRAHVAAHSLRQLFGAQQTHYIAPIFKQRKPRLTLSNPKHPDSITMDKQPLHRRPSWAQGKASYDTYMRNDLSRTRSATSSGDYGMENFSYDDKYIQPFLLPDDLRHAHLPAQVKEYAVDWGFAGAALDTAIERMGKLKGEAYKRGWPDKSHSHISRTHWSQSPTVSGAESWQASSPTSPTDLPQASPPLHEESTVAVVEPDTKYLLEKGMFFKPPMGMESPPFTPVNSQAPSTPANPSEGVRATLPDLPKVNTQLTLSPTATVAKKVDAPQAPTPAGSQAPTEAATPATAGAQGPMQTSATTGGNATTVTSPTGTASTSITSPTNIISPTGTASSAVTSPQSSATSASPGPSFDEHAWEVYLNSYKAELKDLQGQNISRFRGISHTILRMQHEYGAMTEYKDIMKPFGVWWETQKPKVKEYEEKVKKLTVPELEEARKERAAKGLNV